METKTILENREAKDLFEALAIVVREVDSYFYANNDTLNISNSPEHERMQKLADYFMDLSPEMREAILKYFPKGYFESKVGEKSVLAENYDDFGF